MDLRSKNNENLIGKNGSDTERVDHCLIHACFPQQGSVLKTVFESITFLSFWSELIFEYIVVAYSGGPVIFYNESP